MVVPNAGAGRRAGGAPRGIVRLSVSGRQLRKPGPRQALLDAVDLALMHGCAPTVYRWLPDPVLEDAA